MSEIQIPKEIWNKILNLGGLKRDLYCDRCKEYQEHVQVSYAETGGEGWGAKFLGRFNDLVPGAPLLIGNAFACKKCRRVRSEGGLVSDLINKG